MRARDYTTCNPFEPPHSPSHRIREVLRHLFPLQARATLTVEVTRPRGRTQAVLPWKFFRIPSGLKCGERREAGRGAGVHARQAEVTFRTYSLPHGRYAQTAFKEVIEANRRGTWTLNTQTGHVKTTENQMSGYATICPSEQSRTQRNLLAESHLTRCLIGCTLHKIAALRSPTGPSTGQISVPIETEVRKVFEK